jgi:hypothetical protein
MLPYFYNAQLRSYIVQFMNIFSGLQVQTGYGECGEQQFISVPCVMGTKDRVVAGIFSGNTQNKSFSLPIMSANLTSISLAPERRKAPGFVDQRVTMKVGGVFPEDLTTIKRVTPIPYNIQMELSIWASNTQQMHQIMEQILVLFNPDLQIQKSDAPFDYTKITRVELSGINSEENYPSGADKRIIMWSLNFEIPIYLSLPMGVKDDLVRKIIVQIGTSNDNASEVDENGELIPFGEPLMRVEITEQDVINSKN